MEAFSIGKVYIDEQGLKVIDINPLPKNLCSFDCVFCPLGRTALKTDERFYFEETKEFIDRLSKFLDNNEVDMVFLNPDGEAMANEELIDVIKLIKDRNKNVKILTNGYLLNRPENTEVLELCDEVIGEVMVTTESDFQKIQRPMDGFTLEEYIQNMVDFKRWFQGKFILDITLLKRYSDSDEAVEKLKEYIKRIQPDEVMLETPSREKFKEAFGLDEEKFNYIKRALS